jgi:histidinol-phosphate aminotransferase
MYYEYILTINGGVPVFAQWDMPQNKVNVDSILNVLSPRTRIIFLCTPNNPTGGLIDKKDIEIILDRTDALVVVDEAYFEYAGANNVDLLNDYDNLFILRTFSKVMGLAGMRIGYGLGNPQFIQYMHRIKPAFSLTRLSQIAALATLNDKEYIKNSIQLAIKSREYLYTELVDISDLDVFKSKANYLLLDIRKTGLDSKILTKKLMEKGIIVRDCSSFRGLDDYWIRVNVGTIEDDKKFIEVLKEII